MNSIEQWHNRIIGEKVVKALEKNDFHSIYVESKEQALNFIMYHINTGTKVGIGGSMTIQNLGIRQNILEKGGTIIDHSLGTNKEDTFKLMREELTSDLYLCSTNAITLDGYLVNVDGAGNRVAAMTFGPQKVIIVAGVNKIVDNETAAFQRIKLLAAPLNNKRLNLNNPCSISGICTDCHSKSRICRVYSIIKQKPMRSDISVIIVGEHLGY